MRLKSSLKLGLSRNTCFFSIIQIMYFLFSTIFTTIFTSLNAQNLNPSYETSEQLEKIARSENSSGQNGTSESWMDELNDYEIMVYQNFLHSSKLYPSKLKLLLKVGLRFNSKVSINFLWRDLIIRIMESQNSQYFWTMTNWYQLLLEKTNRIFFLIWIYSGLILWVHHNLCLVDQLFLT